jgi:hypothetical protein
LHGAPSSKVRNGHICGRLALPFLFNPKNIFYCCSWPSLSITSHFSRRLCRWSPSWSYLHSLRFLGAQSHQVCLQILWRGPLTSQYSILLIVFELDHLIVNYCQLFVFKKVQIKLLAPTIKFRTDLNATKLVNIHREANY